MIDNRNGSDRCHLAMMSMVPPCAFFDGAAQQGMSACGAFIKTSDEQSFEIHWNAGQGSNNRAEVVALAGLLSFCTFLDIPKFHIYEDSNLITDHVLSKHCIEDIHLARSLDRIAALWNNKKSYIISHTARSNNREANALSKMDLTSPQGVWRMQIKTANNCFQIQDFCLTDI